MACMYPSTVPREVSSAERRVFEELQRALPDDWQVLHSLWIRTHNRKRHAEADFLVISERAVLALEVKGGEVRRDQTGWHYLSPNGYSPRFSHAGPFDQARGVYYALRDFLQQRGRSELFDAIVWGYAVILSDCVLPLAAGDAQIEPRLLLDLRGFPEQLKAFLEDVAGYWTDCCQRKPAWRDGRPVALKTRLDTATRQRLLDVLRPDFDCVRGLGIEARQAEAGLIALTREQYQVLDYAQAEPRNLIEGAAGTGKTLLAFEMARRQWLQGQRVLFLCFSRLLARRLRELAGAASTGQPPLEIANYHQLAKALLRDAGLTAAAPNNWSAFNTWLSEQAFAVVEQAGALERYDVLVVDEAQDLMTEAFCSVLELLVKGGLSGGRWLFCFDPVQAIFRQQFDPAMLARLRGWGRTLPLRLNCRNTRSIAAHVWGLTGAGALPPAGVAGPMPAIHYYADEREYLRVLRQCVNTLVQRFAEAGLPASAITLLTVRHDAIPDEVRRPGFLVRPLVDVQEAGSNSDDRIRYCTVQAFKGLETQAVILTGLRQLDSSYERDLLYVGASRARTVLYLLLPDTAAEQVQAVTMRILEALDTPIEEPPVQSL